MATNLVRRKRQSTKEEEDFVLSDPSSKLFTNSENGPRVEGDVIPEKKIHSRPYSARKKSFVNSIIV